MQLLRYEHKLPSTPMGRLGRFVKGAFTALGLLSLSAVSQAQVSVLTQHNDNARTGANLNETTLTTANVNANSFGKLFVRKFDGEVYAQPLVVSNVTIPKVGKKNIVIVATQSNDLFAFDADDPKAYKPYWKMNFGLPVPMSDFNCYNISTKVGILSAPVVDPATNTLYVLSRNITGDSGASRWVQWFHAIDIATGKEKVNSPRRVPTVTYGAYTFDNAIQSQRVALTLANGVVYVAWASHCDLFNYTGWIICFDAKTLAYKTSFATTPDGKLGGIWQSGQGMTVDAVGNLYCVVGNGDFKANSTDPRDPKNNWGMCYLKMGFDARGRLGVLDYFAPTNRDAWNAADLDSGVSGLTLIPGTNLVVGGSKTGVLYLLNTSNMGGYVASDKDAHAYQWVQATNAEIHNSPVYYNSPVLGQMLYVWGEFSPLMGYGFTKNQMMTPDPVVEGLDIAPDPGGFLAISSNANQAGTGILWASRSLSGGNGPSPGILHAYDADSIVPFDDGDEGPDDEPDLALAELWNSEQADFSRDSIGNFAKFVAPTVANGKVYMASFGDVNTVGSGALVVYGLLPAVAPATPGVLTATPGNTQIRLDWTKGDNLAVRYSVMRGTDPTNMALLADNVYETTYLDNNLQNGTTYYYEVSAINGRGVSAPTNIASAVPNQIINLIGVADSFVRTGASAGTNFGSAQNLSVSVGDTTYLRFDLSGFAGTGVISARLQLFGARSAAGSSTDTVYEVPDNTWTESGITANNLPALGAKQSSATVSPALAWKIWDVSALVRKYRDNHQRYISLAVKREGADAVADSFASREPGVNPPLLTVGIGDYPNYPSGFPNVDDLVFNGGAATGSSTGSLVTNLRLTDLATLTASSVFFNRPVNIQKFRTTFVYSPTKATAAGMTFCVQNNDVTALGAPGSGLGYQQMPNSVAFKIDLFNDVGEGDNSIGVFRNGVAPTLPATNLLNTPINFHWGHTYQFDLTYTGWPLVVGVKDLTTGRSTSNTYYVNIPAMIGNTTGFVGFTASTGTLVSRQDILSWTMSLK